MLTGDSIQLCCRILKYLYWNRTWKTAKPARLWSGCHFVRMVCEDGVACSSTSLLWAICGAPAVSCNPDVSAAKPPHPGALTMLDLHFGAFHAPHSRVSAGSRRGRTSVKDWSLFWGVSSQDPKTGTKIPHPTASMQPRGPSHVCSSWGWTFKNSERLLYSVYWWRIK